MTEAEIRARVRELVLEAAPIKPERAGDADAHTDGHARADLGADLGYDSLGREELAALLEDEFPGLTVPDEAFEIRTVADVETLVLRSLAVRT